MKIIQSTTELRDIPVDDIMIPLESIFMLDANDSISTSLIYKVFKRRYSKMPMYSGDKNTIVGILASKEMITAHEYIGRTVEESFKTSKPLFVAKDQNLLELMTIFQNQSSQVAIVTNQKVREGQSNRQQFHSVVSGLM